MTSDLLYFGSFQPSPQDAVRLERAFQSRCLSSPKCLHETNRNTAPCKPSTTQPRLTSPCKHTGLLRLWQLCSVVRETAAASATVVGNLECYHCSNRRLKYSLWQYTHETCPERAFASEDPHVRSRRSEDTKVAQAGTIERNGGCIPDRWAEGCSVWSLSVSAWRSCRVPRLSLWNLTSD